MVRRFSLPAALTVALFVCAAEGSATVRALDRMLLDLAPLSARSAGMIRRAYQEHLALLRLNEYAELAGALDNGGLVPLPEDSLRFNIIPRLEGRSPIGEMDLDNQSSYVAARPAAMGALLEIASQVTSGPLEVTSLVRHGDYQDVLRGSNPNATTAVPMHTMGLAVDIALINTPMRTVYELRDVLRRMQDAGDILFIGERRQLVFHIVPHPTRLGYFTEVYQRSVGMPPTSRFAEAVAFSGEARQESAVAAPKVTTEILAVLPAEGPVQNLWVEAEPEVAPPPSAPPTEDASAAGTPSLLVLSYWRATAPAPWIALFVGFAVAWLLASRPPPLRPLLEPYTRARE